MLLHNSQMHGITRRDAAVTEHNLLGAFCNGPVHWQYLIDNAKRSVECRLDGIATIDRHVAMQYLLQHLCVCDEALSITH